MKKHRNKSMVGMVAVLLILIVMFTTVVDAAAAAPAPTPDPLSSEITIFSASPSPSTTTAAPTPATTEAGTVWVYRDKDNNIKGNTIRDNIPSEYHSSAVPAVKLSSGSPSSDYYVAQFAQDFSVNQEGRFVSGTAGRQDEFLEFTDQEGNFVIKRSQGSSSVEVERGFVQRDTASAVSFAIRENKLDNTRIFVSNYGQESAQISAELAADIIGAGRITNVANDHSTDKSNSPKTTITRSDNTQVTLEFNAKEDIKLNTVTAKAGNTPLGKEYTFSETGLRGREDKDGNIVFESGDRKITVPKESISLPAGTSGPPIIFEQKVKTGINVKIKGEYGDWKLSATKDNGISKQTLVRESAQQTFGNVKGIGLEHDKVKVSDELEFLPDGATKESRLYKNGEKIVDIGEITTRNANGQVIEKIERGSAGALDVGRVDFGFFEVGGNEGNRLKRTVYGADGKTYTQVSNEFNVDKVSANFDNSPLINYDPDTGQIKSYPAASFNPDAPSGEKVETTVSTKLGFGGLFGTPAEIEKMQSPAKEAAIEAYNKAAAAERANRFASAQDFAQTFGQLSSLFADNGAFKAWNRRTDMLFNNWVLGGSEYRVSKICESNLRKVGDNVLVVQTPGGQLVTAAFVNGERQLFEFPNGTKQFLYKISYKVSIPESLIDKAETQKRQRIRAIDDPVPEAPARILRKDPGSGKRLEEFLAEGPFFNVILSGKSGRKCLFIDSGSQKCEGESVKKGANAVQRNMFVKYSSNDYNRVCIEFTRSLEFANKKSNSICGEIVGVDEKPRNVVDVPEIPTVNPSLGSGTDASSQGAAGAPISTTATGQITTADI